MFIVLFLVWKVHLLFTRLSVWLLSGFRSHDIYISFLKI
jgi:hypothetical protein